MVFYDLFTKSLQQFALSLYENIYSKYEQIEMDLIMLTKKVFNFIEMPRDDVLDLTSNLIQSIETSIERSVKLFCPLLTPLANLNQVSDSFLKHLDLTYASTGNELVYELKTLFQILRSNANELKHFIILIEKYNVSLPLHSEFKKRFLDSLEQMYKNMEDFETVFRKCKYSGC